MIIQEIAWSWYWLGYSIGVNSRKRIKESPDKLINQGKQGVITVPTDKQKTSFFLGLSVGRRKIVNNLNQIIVKTTQGKNSLSTADMLTLAIGEVQGVRGGYVDVPVFYKNNRADNRGVAAFQLKLTYDSTKLDVVSITQASSWVGTFTEDTTTAGTILAQGIKDIVDRVDCLICTIRFYVKYTVDNNVAEISLKNVGSPGSGSGSELLTKINDELYYITPIKLENGKILLESIPQESTKLGSITVPSTGTATIGTGSSSVNYNFTADVSVPEGTIPNGGVSAIVNVYLDSELIGTQRVHLEVGSSKTYSGKIPLTLPSLKTGKISYEIVVESDNQEEKGFFYVFIKAGALFILESEVKREEVGEIPLEPLSRTIIDRLYITDYVIFEKYKQSCSGQLNLVITEKLNVITDSDTITLHKQNNNIDSDSMKITDTVIFEKYRDGKLVKDSINLVITDKINIVDSHIVETNIKKSETSEDTMKITDMVLFTKSKT